MIVTVRTHRPCLLYDATGAVLKDCVWADTETGEVVQFVRDANGRFVLNDFSIAKERRIYPAPLRVEKLKAQNT